MVLLLGVTVVGIGGILLYGNAALLAQEQTVDVDQTEHAFEQLDSRASRVAQGNTRSQTVDLGLHESGGTLSTAPDNGTMTIRLVDVQTGDSQTVANVTLGAVVYENHETTIAYQGGAVWRSDSGAAVPVSRPPIQFQNKTLGLSVITIANDDPVYSELRISKAGEPVRKFPAPSENFTNKLETTKLVITIQSEYYEAWAQFFRSETDAIVFTDNASETVTVKFLAAPRRVKLRDGLTATSGTGKLELAGNGAYTDSYNSSEGPYSESQSGNGTVWAAGDVEMAGDSEINGSIRSGANVTLGSSATVYGDVYWTENYEQGSATVTGINDSIDGVAAIEPIDLYVKSRVGQLSKNNDNARTSLITGNELSVGQGESEELGPGQYYVEHLEVEGGKLVLNATDGDITIGVRDYVLFEKGGNDHANVSIIGNGTVTIFVASEDGVSVSPTGLGNRDVNFHVGKKSQVNVPDQRSIQFRIFSTGDFKATIAGSSGSQVYYVGTIYAPGGTHGEGYVYVKQADFYGGIVASNLTLGQNGAVHYDEVLGQTAFPLSPGVSRIEYFYATIRPINVTSSEP